MGDAIFETVEQSVAVLWRFTGNLVFALAWAWIAIAHLMLLAFALLALWVTQTAPADVWACVRALYQAAPVAALSAAGVSAMTLLALYWKLMRWAQRAIGAWLARAMLPTP